MLQHEIDSVLSKAYSEKLIGSTLKDSSLKTPHEKARSFLQVVTSRIETDPKNKIFDKFLNILRSLSSLEHLADRLEEKIREIHQPATETEQTDSASGSSASVQKTRPPKSRRNRDQPSPPLNVQFSSDSGESDDESETDDDKNDKLRPSKNRKKRRTRSGCAKAYPSIASESKSVSASPVQQPKLETTEIESGIETATSEYVEGDIPMSSHEACTTQQDMNTPTDRVVLEIDISHLSTSSATVTTSQISAEEPASPLPKQNGGNIAANEDVIHFTAPVQPSDSEETLTDGDSKKQSLTHSQASEQQPQNGRIALVPGSAAPQLNENDWADKARYYVAVGASRETEKDKQIEELIEEKKKLEQILQEKETQHAKVITRESEDHARQMVKLKEQLVEKEQELTSVFRKHDKELEMVMEEKAQQQQLLEEYKSEMEGLKKRIGELEKEIAKKSETIEAQTQKLHETKAKIKNLEAQLEAKVKIIEDLEQKKAAIEEEFKKKISKLKYELESEKKAAVANERYLEADSKLKLSEQKNKFSDEKHTLMLQIKDLEKKVLEMQHQQKLQERDKKVEKLEHEVRRLSLFSTSSSEASLNVSRAATSDNQDSQLKSVADPDTSL